jgi:lipopolysaccharide export LptBFGC system permease protein LptF
MGRDVVWLTSFALVILAVVLVINTLAPQINQKAQGVRNEPPPVATVP